MPKSILVADDSQTIQTAIQMSFASEDVILTVVADGETALARAREGNYHVILCDHVMAGLDGYTLCDALKKDPRTAHIPVLLLTGSAKPYDDARAQAIGIDDHIAKPFDSQALLDKTFALVNQPKPVQTPGALSKEANSFPTPSNASFPGNNTPNPFTTSDASPFSAPAPDPFAPPTESTTTNPFTTPSAPFTDAVETPGPATPRPGRAIVVDDSYDENLHAKEEEQIQPTPTLLGMPAIPIQSPSNQSSPNDQNAKDPVPTLAPPPIRLPSISPPQNAKKSSVPIPTLAVPKPPTVPSSLGKTKVPDPARQDTFAKSSNSSSPVENKASSPPSLRLEKSAPENNASSQNSSANSSMPSKETISEETLRRVLSQASRELIEKVVWEVVPDLAETIIREEIDRILKQLQK